MFIEICLGIVNTTLNECDVLFSNKASVCKYAVPEGYPDSPIKNERIDISKVENPDQLYLASVDLKNNILLESGSRTVAVVGIADTLHKAEAIAENEIKHIVGPLFHRKDIGTSQLINKRIHHMKALRD